MRLSKILTTAVLLCICANVIGQNDSDSESETRSLYLGFSTGINNYAGLIGITGEFRVAPPISVIGALGVGSWGTKSSIGLRYYPHYPELWSFTLAYSHCSGIQDIKVKMEEDFVKDQDGSKDIEMDLLSIATVNLTATKHWLIGKRKVNRIHLELGYAIPTDSERYRIPVELTSQGKKFMRMLEPGGIIIGTGITFGLRP